MMTATLAVELGAAAGRREEAISKSKGENAGGEAGWQIKGACFLFENPIVKKSAFK